MGKHITAKEAIRLGKLAEKRDQEKKAFLARLEKIDKEIAGEREAETY